MASSKMSGSGYAIRFDASSTRDSSGDEADSEEDGTEKSSIVFTDPLNASLLNNDKLFEQALKKMKKKKVDVVKLETVKDAVEHNINKESMSLDVKQSEAEEPKEKSLKSKESMIKPLSALNKKHSSSFLFQPQSAPSSELSSPTTLSKRQHMPPSVINSNSSCKDMSGFDADKDSKASLISGSDVSLNSNVNNKEDMFSIFSGLKDKFGRFSAESREILDRKVFKTSVDVPKIASVLTGNAIEGELLAEEAREDTQFEVFPSPKGSDDKWSLDSVKQSSIDSCASSEPMETEMKEMSRGGVDDEVQSGSFDIGRLMKLVNSDSSKKLSSKNGFEEEKRGKELFEDYESMKLDDSFSALDISMTPSDILTHESAVDAFRSSASSLLDPGTKRLNESTTGHSKLAKKSSVTGSPVQKNPFLSEKKETISKSSSITMTLSSLLSRQKSNSKLNLGSSPETIVMTSKTADLKSKSVVESPDISTESRSDEVEVVRTLENMPTSDDACEFVFQSSDRTLAKYVELFKRRVSTKFLSVVIIVLAWLCIPFPPYVAGMLIGIIGTVIVIKLMNFFHNLFSTGKRLAKEHQLLETDSPSLVGDSGLDVRESRNVDGSFKGWLNELGSGTSNVGKVVYDPKDYHINTTHTIYVTLEGTNLRLQTPRLSMPKRALWSDESPTSVTFIRQRHYDLLGSKVSLLPDNLVSKRLWSKKYPIHVVITKANLINNSSTLRSRTNKISSAATKGTDVQVEDDQPKTSQSVDTNPISSRHDVAKKVLYLFARTSREKEEWFRRFRAASMGIPWPTRFSDVVKNLGPVNKKTHTKTASQQSKKSIAEIDQLPGNNNNIPDGATSDNSDPFSDNLSSIDYSSLTPEQNLAYYARYMSRSMMKGDTKTDSNNSSVSTDAASMEKEPPNKKSSSIGGNSDKKGREQSKKDGGVKNGNKEEEKERDEAEKKLDVDVCNVQLLWLNTLVSRCFMDFLREKYWVEKIREKIQKKLSKIHVPYVMDQLLVTGIDLGSSVPTICSASPPYLDDRGFWVDLKLSYSGGFCITMETKCNLMKLKQNSASKNTEGGSTDGSVHSGLQGTEKRMAALYSDEEDSAESSTDEESRLFEEDFDETGEDKKSNRPIGKRLMSLVDKISQSRYFQQATDYKYIRRAIEEVSNTRLELNVEVKSLVGTLAVNVPPPPTDRIWYGFRGNPLFDLVARPKVGVRQVSLAPVTEWIEKKLAIEFQRVFVMPNMDDVKIPLMLDHLNQSPSEE